jgi:hypothetical protein
MLRPSPRKPVAGSARASRRRVSRLRPTAIGPKSSLHAGWSNSSPNCASMLPASLRRRRNVARDVQFTGLGQPPGGCAEIGGERQSCNQQKGERKSVHCRSVPPPGPHWARDFTEGVKGGSYERGCCRRVGECQLIQQLWRTSDYSRELATQLRPLAVLADKRHVNDIIVVSAWSPVILPNCCRNRTLPSRKKSMRVSGVVLMLSAVAIGDAWAGETLLRSQQISQMDRPKQGSSSSGSCMPIGLTAKGELVFPWDCREIIERERGPVSVDLSLPSKEPGQKDPVAGEPALKASPKTAPKAAAINDAASKDQAASQSAEPDHVATIPDTAVSPPQPSAASDRRSQGKQVAARRRTDTRDPRGPVLPVVAPPIRTRLPVHPPG